MKLIFAVLYVALNEGPHTLLCMLYIDCHDLLLFVNSCIRSSTVHYKIMSFVSFLWQPI